MNVWASPSLNLPVVKNKQESNDSKCLHSAIRYLSHLGFKSFAKIREVIYFLMNIWSALADWDQIVLFATQYIPDMSTIPNVCWSHRRLEIPQIPQTSLY